MAQRLVSIRYYFFFFGRGFRYRPGSAARPPELPFFFSDPKSRPAVRQGHVLLLVLE
jgi:hypothetical protein